MKFESFVAILYLIYETFYLVKGQVINEEKNDCTKLYNYIRGDNKTYSIEECCSEDGIICNNGYITTIEL